MAINVSHILSSLLDLSNPQSLIIIIVAQFPIYKTEMGYN